MLHDHYQGSNGDDRKGQNPQLSGYLASLHNTLDKRQAGHGAGHGRRHCTNARQLGRKLAACREMRRRVKTAS